MKIPALVTGGLPTDQKRTGWPASGALKATQSARPGRAALEALEASVGSECRCCHGEGGFGTFHSSCAGCLFAPKPNSTFQSGLGPRQAGRPRAARLLLQAQQVGSCGRPSTQRSSDGRPRRSIRQPHCCLSADRNWLSGARSQLTVPTPCDSPRLFCYLLKSGCGDLGKRLLQCRTGPKHSSPQISFPLAMAGKSLSAPGSLSLAACICCLAEESCFSAPL